MTDGTPNPDSEQAVKNEAPKTHFQLVISVANNIQPIITNESGNPAIDSDMARALLEKYQEQGGVAYFSRQEVVSESIGEGKIPRVISLTGRYFIDPPISLLEIKAGAYEAGVKTIEIPTIAGFIPFNLDRDHILSSTPKKAPERTESPRHFFRRGHVQPAAESHTAKAVIIKS
jgi:hypothetical protein